MRSPKIALLATAAIALLIAAIACEGGGPGGRRRGRAPAKPLPAIFHSFPANTAVAVALTDLDAFRAGWKQTALNEAWEGPNMQKWRQESWPKFKALLTTQIGMSEEELDGLFHGDMVLLLVKSEESPANKPAAVALIRPSNNKPQVEAFAKKISEGAGAGKITSRWVNEILILSNQEALLGEVESNLKANASPIEKSEGFGALAAGYESKAFVHVWVNGAQDAKAESGKTPAANAANAANASGLAGAYGAVALQKKGFLTHSLIQLRGERPKVMNLIGESAPSKAIRLTPPDVQAFFSLRHAGLTKILETAHSMGLENGETTEEEWKAQMAELNGRLGVNVESDLPKMIGKELAVSVTQGMPLPQIALYVESTDGPALIKVIDNLFARSGQAVTESEQQGVRFKQVMLPLGFLPLQLAYAQVGDFVVLSSPATGLLAAASALKSRKSLADDPGYKQAAVEAGPVGWYESYSRPGEGMSMGPLGLVLPGILAQVNQQTGLNVAMGDITNFQLVASDKTPAVSRCRTNGDAIESQGYLTSGLMAVVLDPAFVGMAASLGSAVKSLRQANASPRIKAGKK